jgi:hypothetical protein
MINGDWPKLGPNAGLKARKIGSARAALLPIRSRLLAHREGRKLYRYLGDLGFDDYTEEMFSGHLQARAEIVRVVDVSATGRRLFWFASRCADPAGRYRSER